METQTVHELPKNLDPKSIETKWYPKWETEKYFTPKAGKTGKSYCVIMPPPNVTGMLHAGHALDLTVQDVIIRFKRMKGFKTLYLPGMDHAGIATQAKVEELIYKTEKKTKHDLGREEFVQRTWKWKEEYGGVIAKQSKYLGLSCDWDYFIFTMDEESNEAVRKAFCDLYNEGLIYQSDYIISWDPELQSAISDAEVDHKEIKGAFYHILYPVKDSNIKLEIATTRPETMFGDTAVAVNPNDERFKHLIGKKVILPLANKEIPIIADEHVDIEMGTGCLKVTPGHDFNDFEIGKRHNLDMVNILNKDGTLNEHGLEWKGLKCTKARPKVIDRLEQLGLFVKKIEHTHQVGHSQRSDAMVEPMVSKQWFLNVQAMSKVAMNFVEKDETRFYPKGWENTFFAWLREPKNWCISRQLWWGHQIPVFYCNKCNHRWASQDKEKTCPKCKSNNIYQDPDVLDTWFSSGLWPITTLGWPNVTRMKERKFDEFFPTSTLVTGFDIIFFWVARMMMMVPKFTGKHPFEKIYIHAIVTDKLGRKMSKSLGNGIDPIEMIDTYGADALRFAMASGSGYNRNLNLDPERIEGCRNFMNKIWNAFRFIHPFLHNATSDIPALNKLDSHEKWIISELNEVTQKMNDSMEEFRFDDASSAIYQFVYDKFCSWFIELSKSILYGTDEAKKTQRATLLKYCFRKICALLHPITPFVTEEFWAYLKRDNEDLLIIQDYPEYEKSLSFLSEQENMNKLIEIITSIRNIRISLNVKPKDMIKVNLFSDDDHIIHYFKENEICFADLAKVETITYGKKTDKKPTKAIMNATTHTEIFVPLEGVIDLAAHISKLEKELDKTKKEYDQNNNKLKNPNFVDHAPEDVLNKVKEKATALKEKIDSLEENLKVFK